LLRCLNGLQQASGRVEVAGSVLRDVGAWREHRRHTGMIFQTHQLILRQSALANVLNGRLGSRPLWRSALPPARSELMLALEALERVGLAERAHQPCERLSGGERQRVGIARALVQRPRLILADEPVASLDPATARTVLELIRSACLQDGITALVSLHQVDLARDFGARVLGMRAGRLVCDCGPAALDERVVADIYRPDPGRELQPALPPSPHAPASTPAFQGL
jgi:phosphonate transport system ATP-binding protein